MKLIFLDIDGVLNDYHTFEIQAKTGCHLIDELDDEYLNNLSILVKETDAKIVLSSSWRSYLNDDLTSNGDMGDVLISKLKEHGLSLYAKTPYDKSRKRGIEIKRYLEETSDNIESFVILDDNVSDIIPVNILKRRVVKTRFDQPSDYKESTLNGLSKFNLNKALKILSRKGDNKMWSNSIDFLNKSQTDKVLIDIRKKLILDFKIEESLDFSINYDEKGNIVFWNVSYEGKQIMSSFAPENENFDMTKDDSKYIYLTEENKYTIYEYLYRSLHDLIISKMIKLIDSNESIKNAIKTHIEK